MNVYFAHALEQAPLAHCAGNTRGGKSFYISKKIKK